MASAWAGSQDEHDRWPGRAETPLPFAPPEPEDATPMVDGSMQNVQLTLAMAFRRAGAGIPTPLIKPRIVEPQGAGQPAGDEVAQGELQGRGPCVASAAYGDERSADEERMTKRWIPERTKRLVEIPRTTVGGSFRAALRERGGEPGSTSPDRSTR